MTAYADAMLRMFHRNIERVTTLGEPRTTRPARARRITALLVETLGGFAYGTAAGQLERAVAVWFGPERKRVVRDAIQVPTHRVERVFELEPDPSFARDMLAALRTRTTVAARDLAALEAAVVAILPADHARLADAMFSELNRDSVFDDRLEVEIQTGWTFACAAIERRPVQTLEISPRASNLWAMWSQLAGNPAAEPARSPDHLNGYITRVG